MDFAQLRGKLSRAPETLFRLAIKRSFNLGQALGIHVVPNHFYEPIPDTRTLDRRLWEKASELPGIDMNDAGQVALLETLAERYRLEYEAFPRHKSAVPYQYAHDNPSFRSVDAEILYALVRHFKPRRIFEIGSGNSTYLSAQALLKNAEQTGTLGELTAFEPYPSEVLRTGFPGLTRLEPRKIQEIPLERFQELAEGDILFVDSSHVLKIGSDVQYEFLEILPRLQRGVLVHFHDIFLPAEYPREWVLDHKIFWNEQYLLQAFLTFNDHYRVLWGGSYMHLRHSEALAKHIRSYGAEHAWPGSFWIQKIK